MLSLYCTWNIKGFQNAIVRNINSYGIGMHAKKINSQMKLALAKMTNL